jgi:broad specificity phosphatase PhoE
MTVPEKSKVARIFLIRHADAAGYRKDPVFGNHLTDIGRRQAQALAKRASAWQVDAIICSDLHRAYETALAVHEYHPHVPLRVDQAFRELDLQFSDMPRDICGVLRELETSQRQLEHRLNRAWEAILTIPYDVALVITHRRTIKYLIGRVIGHEQILKSRLQIANASITAIEISRAHREGILQFVNDTTHLTPEMIPVSPGAPWAEAPETGRWLFGTFDHEAIGRQLTVGQWVKVRGAAVHDGNFIALEVIPRAAKKHAGLEGIIQSINHRQSTLRIVNKDIWLPKDIPVRTEPLEERGLAHLREGDAVKISGRWQRNEFVPEKIKVKSIRGFSLEEIEGPISNVDPVFKRFHTLGLAVMLHDKTSVEGRYT